MSQENFRTELRFFTHDFAPGRTAITYLDTLCHILSSFQLEPMEYCCSHITRTLFLLSILNPLRPGSHMHYIFMVTLCTCQPTMYSTLMRHFQSLSMLILPVPVTQQSMISLQASNMKVTHLRYA